jgi:methyl-accepting chemotaxis protein
MTLMDEATQQNASLVEEATAAAESLLEQANALADAVSVFKLDEANITFTDNVIKMHPVAKPQLISANKQEARIKVADYGNTHWDHY